MYKISIAENIKKRRLELNLSQQELADFIGYKSRSTIAKIEAGKNYVPQSKLTRFALALDTSVEFLLSGVEKGRSFSYTTEHSKAVPSTEENDSHKNIVIVLAGGKSTRNFQNIPNQFINVMGKPVIIYCLEAYQRHPAIDEIYVVCLKGWESILGAYAKQYGITKLRGIVPAGNSGINSIKNGIKWLERKAMSGEAEYSPDDTIILQESTRPMVTEEIISKLLYASKSRDSVAICEPMDNYVQFYKSDDKIKYISRNNLIALQSPEAHKFAVLKEVFIKAKQEKRELDETCCSMFLYNLGYPINFCEGNYNNIKIVRQEDIAIFSVLLKQLL